MMLRDRELEEDDGNMEFEDASQIGVYGMLNMSVLMFIVVLATLHIIFNLL